MARRSICLVSAAFGLLSCASARSEETTAEQPAWFAARVAEAESRAAQRGYPALSEFPEYRRPERSQSAWEAGVQTMAAIRDALLSDPAMIDPDSPGSAEEFASRSRADAEADMRRQTVDED